MFPPQLPSLAIQMSDIPPEYYYLAEEFSPYDLTLPEIQSILIRHNIHLPKSYDRQLVTDIWNTEITAKRQELLESIYLSRDYPEYFYLDPTFDPSGLSNEDMTQILSDHHISAIGKTRHRDILIPHFKNKMSSLRPYILKEVKSQYFTPFKYKYLERGFDPNMYSTPQLREILSNYTLVKEHLSRRSLIRLWDRTIPNERLSIIDTCESRGEISHRLATVLRGSDKIEIQTPSDTQSPNPLSPTEDPSPPAMKERTGKYFDTEDSFASSGDDEFIEQPIKGDDDWSTDGIDEDIDKEELLTLINDLRVPATVVKTSMKNEYLKRKFIEYKQRTTRMLYHLNCIVFTLSCICFLITFYNRKHNGYCDDMQLSSLSFQSLLPAQCIPCPEHATCIDGEMHCDKFFNRKPSLYSFNHTLPISDYCAYDTTYSDQVDRMERKIRKSLATLQGNYNCRQYQQDTTFDLRTGYTVQTSLESIRNEYIDKSEYMPDIEFIVDAAITALMKDPRVRVEEGDMISTEYVNIPVVCHLMKLYNSIPNTVKLYTLAIIAVIYIVFSGIQEYKRRKSTRTKLRNLLGMVTQILSEQRKLHRENGCEPTVSATDLRTRLFDITDKSSIKEWQMVVKELESNPNFRKSMLETRGEPVEHWEIIA
ncbi:Man1-Src1p-C-terminal domain-containing protein [Pilobolus umbonatus]|nr:Man1-Src1p-C-terminal domain-containing protein [Pilobolus umbonatus]